MRLVLPLLTVLFCCTACAPDPTSDPGVSLVGDWELVGARNDGRPTNVIRELVFSFGTDGTFGTNLMGNTEPGNYELTDGEVVTTGVKVPLTYRIESLTDSTLHLRTEVRGRQFDFEMRRAGAAE